MLSEDSQQQAENERHLQQVLTHFSVNTLVIGHTPATQPEHKYGGKLIVVEAEQTESALLIREGRADFIQLELAKIRFSEQQPQYRAFNLFNMNDWRALTANKAHLTALNQAKAFFNRDRHTN